MGEWLSSRVKEQPEVREALSDLADKINEYKDAAKPTACRETGGSFGDPELMLFRPDWRLFLLISVVYGITGIIFSWHVSDYPADEWTNLLGKWTDLSLRITIPVFVIGISLVTLARAISESRRFAGEYLNDSCRMPWFCCLTLIAVLFGVIGLFVSTIKWFPNFMTVGLCMTSVGAAIDCLAMLAFVIRETIRCSIPSESVRVVLPYAARKLTWGYFKEKHITLFQRQQKDYLEKYCAGKAIHPPSQYPAPYTHSDNADNRVEIKLDGDISGRDVYKDYDLKGLERLDRYLRKNSAELYLISPFFEGERTELGILSCANVKQNERLQSKIRKKGGKAIRRKKHEFSEENAKFWDSHFSALEEALKSSIKNGESSQVKRCLEVVLKPLSSLRTLKGYKIIADADNSVQWRSYDFVRFYIKAIKAIMEIGDSDHIHALYRELRNAIWEETKNILRDMDYHTMELYTWLVQQMYTLIKDKDKGERLQKMRAQFGGFYESAEYWFEDSELKNADDVNKMRLVLHEGLTKWLLLAIKKKDIELIEQLCEAGRRIVFGRGGIKFDNKEVVAQHFVLAGHLIGLVKSGDVSATAVEKLFVERHSHEPKVDFDELVRFYLDTFLPPKLIGSYLDVFYSPTETHTDLLTGSSSSSGFGMTGYPQMALAFIFLAAHALKNIHPLPQPVAGMSGRRITDSDIDIVSEVFGSDVKYGCEQLRRWLKNCDELDKAEEAKEIAKADLVPAKVKEWDTKFWEGYSRAMPFLPMCLKNGNYEINENAKNEQRYSVPKIALFDWRYPISGAEGDRYGLEIGQEMEKKILSSIISGSKEESEIGGGLAEAIVEAVKWMEREGCANNNSIVIVASKEFPEIALSKEKDFIPSWREDVKSMGFDGFYRGFPIVRLRGDEEEEEKKEGEKAEEKKAQCQKVVAVDLREWIGFRVRKEVVTVTDRKFGELRIRTWTDEEIQKAIDSGKLDAKDTDKAKGNCPVDLTFYWESIKDKLPRTRTFKFGSL